MVHVTATAAAAFCGLPYPFLGGPACHIQKVGQPLAAATAAAQAGVRAVDARPSRRRLEAVMLLLKVDQMTASQRLTASAGCCPAPTRGGFRLGRGKNVEVTVQALLPEAGQLVPVAAQHFNMGHPRRGKGHLGRRGRTRVLVLDQRTAAVRAVAAGMSHKGKG